MTNHVANVNNLSLPLTPPWKPSRLLQTMTFAPDERLCSHDPSARHPLAKSASPVRLGLGSERSRGLRKHAVLL